MEQELIAMLKRLIAQHDEDVKAMADEGMACEPSPLIEEARELVKRAES